MTRLHLDFETRSRLDLKLVGMDRYVRECEPLLLGWAIDDAEPKVEEGGPDNWLQSELQDALADPHVTKVAWHANFERAVLSHAPGFGIDIPIEHWLDPMVYALYAGIHGKLDVVSTFLQLGDKAKMKEGKKLIDFFCKPISAGKRKGTFNSVHQNLDKWNLFRQYCAMDIVSAREILHRLSHFFTPPERERRVWELDAKMNQRGLPVSRRFVQSASVFVNNERERLLNELKELTGLENPNSVPQLTAWLQEQGYPYGSLAAAKVTAALEMK